MPLEPKKRKSRTSATLRAPPAAADSGSDLSPPPSDDELPAPPSPAGSADSGISSDTYGSVPGSPGVNDDNLDQVTQCRWDGCMVECGNMDNLVAHIHDAHVGNRKPKYACEWQDCPRRGLSQTSRFALVAHMRSHTGEKPFYCNIPECDRSFTRSDALAKHMRTVHESERPPGEVPTQTESDEEEAAIRNAVYMADLNAVRRFRETAGGRDRPPPPGTVLSDEKPGEELASDELGRTPRELVRYLKRKLSWAGEAHRELEEELERVNRLKNELWVTKELLLEQVITKELGAEEASKIAVVAPAQEQLQQT
ncbi:uncharacterized protein V1518DRAFT_417055 [Limtongia smithiae]|uniref:uncharacterized protein n=1 Tax=Limtongia smithiae TaxID=1125753 RepID=UPI0034CDFB7C